MNNTNIKKRKTDIFLQIITNALFLHFYSLLHTTMLTLARIVRFHIFFLLSTIVTLHLGQS